MNSTHGSSGIEAFLQIGPVRLQKIRSMVMFLVYQDYIRSNFKDTIDMKVLFRELTHQFKGNDLVTAAYIIGGIEKEVQTGENLFVLEDLRKFAHLFYDTAELTLQQFKKICKNVSTYYLKNGRIH